MQVTDEVLAEIGAQDVPRIRIFNKIDQVGLTLEPDEREALQHTRDVVLRAQYPGCIVMSAVREEDIARLRQAILDFFQRDLVEAEFLLPWSAQQLRGEIFANCQVLEERADGEGAYFRVRGEDEVIRQLREKIG